MGALSLAAGAETIQMMAPPAFTDLYQRYSETVYRAALRVTGNPADAEDAMQTVFMRVLNQGGRLDPVAVPERYFRRAAANAGLDILRRRVSKAESQLDDALPHATSESSPLLKQRLRQALASLEARDAEIFVLRYVEGLSNGEIAGLCGVEKARIAVRLHRIRQELKAELEG
ncbi:MAG: sigma-70 family RNA polymerase sigma factor [Candidatus Solibacter usitatus]|nr:sigma-70 family RNA polymerase sigma factor [Candidatus Solibacter usitatus]